MNSLFRRLSPQQQAWLLDHGVLLIAVPLAVLLVALFFIFWRIEPHEHVGFVPGEVLATHDIADDTQYRVRGVVRLPDDTEISLVARGLGQAQWFAQETCVEVRETRQSGRKVYRLAAPAKCRD